MAWGCHIKNDYNYARPFAKSKNGNVLQNHGILSLWKSEPNKFHVNQIISVFIFN